MEKVELDLQRRDLRRTAMVRMSESGATDMQIAAVSGHSIEQTRQILTIYIPRRGEVAAGAIAAWERMSAEQDMAAAAAEVTGLGRRRRDADRRASPPANAQSRGCGRYAGGNSGGVRRERR